MAIGPTLPPHLVKRKRSPEDSTDSATEQSSRQVPGSSPDSTSSKRTKVTGPEPPPVAVPTVRRPVAGPSLPPGPLDERPTNSPSAHNHLEDDSDDDFGPALPSADAVSDLTATSVHNPQIEPEARDEGPKLKRDDWMIAPPDGSDWSARADPLKLQGRKFNTGKSARTPGTKGAKESVLWTETAEQKRKRLEDEVMGVQQPAQSDQGVRKSTRSDAEKRETEKRIREYNVRVMVISNFVNDQC